MSTVAGPEEMLASTVEDSCLAGPEEVAVPVELLFGGGRLCGPGDVDGPVDRCHLAGPGGPGGISWPFCFPGLIN